MLTKLKALFQSSRFWVGVAGLLVVCADSFFGEGTVSPETVQMVTLLAGAWIVGDSLRVTELFLKERECYEPVENPSSWYY